MLWRQCHSLPSSSLSTGTMPTSASSAISKPSSDLLGRLTAADDAVKLKALRDIKNQIIGNRTKKLSFIKLGVVPHVAAILSSTSDPNILVQSAAILGSFSCGVDAGVSAVLDAGAFPQLLRLLSDPDPKVPLPSSLLLLPFLSILLQFWELHFLGN